MDFRHRSISVAPHLKSAVFCHVRAFRAIKGDCSYCHVNDSVILYVFSCRLLKNLLCDGLTNSAKRGPFLFALNRRVSGIFVNPFHVDDGNDSHYPVLDLDHLAKNPLHMQHRCASVVGVGFARGQVEGGQTWGTVT